MNDLTAESQQVAHQHNKIPACLYVVATPIGNLGDFSERAKLILEKVDWIAAEDTRHTQKLLSAFGLRRPLMALHQHNEEQRSQQLIALLRQGKSLALVSDAGTPLISDPGFPLVRAVRAAGFDVVPIPGACALIAALSASGLPTDEFYFAGFLPAKALAREQRLQGLTRMTATLAFYESPHRLLPSLQALALTLGGDRQMCLARELTKRYETFLSGSIDQVLAQVEADAQQQKGEFVLLIEGAKARDEEQGWDEACRWMLALEQEMPPSQAAALVARMTGVKKKPLYQWFLQQGDEKKA